MSMDEAGYIFASVFYGVNMEGTHRNSLISLRTSYGYFQIAENSHMGKNYRNTIL